MGNRLEPQLPDMAMNRQKGKSLISSILFEHLKKHNYLINIIGNICAGKSTLMELLRAEIPKATYLKIDDYRQKLNADSPDADAIAWSYLIDDALQKRFVFVESTGASKHFWRMNSEFQGFTITIWVHEDTEICLKRYKERPTTLQISEKYKIEGSLKYIEFYLSQYFLKSKSPNLIHVKTSELKMEELILHLTNIILSNAKNE